ncbi:MAG: autotransporter assembly complex protein TamA [Magnetococcus sp. YQC-5]
MFITNIKLSTADDINSNQQQKLFEYRVTFQGLEQHAELADLLREIAVTVKRQKDPPISRFLLLRRAHNDQKLFINALKSQGYFDGHAGVAIFGRNSPYEVIFRIEPKTRYHLADPILRITPPDASFKPPTWAKLGLVQGNPVETARIIKAETDLLQHALEQGYPWAKAGKRRVRSQPEKQLIVVEYLLELGRRVQLGSVRIQGNAGVDESFLRRRIPWQAGVWYHPKRLDETRQALVSTGLFSLVRLQLAKNPDPQGFWPLEVELKERKHRTWRAGAAFSTDRGAVLNGGWEHRNLRNAGERLRTEANLGIATMTWNSSYDIPDFRQRGQKLRFSGKFEQAVEEAYENISMDLGAGLVRPLFGPGGEGSLTLNYRLSNVLELSTQREKSYSVASMPLGVSLDRSNDPLDPSHGWRFSTEIAPHLAVTGESAKYLRWNNRGSVYYPWPGISDLVLAGRGELDVTFGAERDAIPVDSRLYAGGGSSLRGYGQQLASPLDATGKPMGGASLLALSTEVRYRLTESFGMVAFVDAGRAFAATVPAKELNLLYGTGLGLRYITPIGPLRLDVALPMQRRDQVDAAFQFYMSIGQAF